MFRSRIAGIGMFVPENVVGNNQLAEILDTSDEWIQERTGIKERRFAERYKDTTTTMAYEASKIAIERAGVDPMDIELILFATLSPDYYFPGCAVLLQRMFSMREIGAIDIRNQCSGFIFALSVADQFIKTGMYKNILVVGSETHSYALDFSRRGRNLSVIFGDGAGAVLLKATENPDQGILSTHLHSDGTEAEILSMMNPGFHAGRFVAEKKPKTPESPYGGMFLTKDLLEKEDIYPFMDGPAVFKKAVVKLPEVINEALGANGYRASDLKLMIPHQANLRISQYVQQKLGLRDDQVYNNIQKYGNTTAASIPIALCEAWQQDRVNEGDLVCLASFGSGFTWGSALMKW